MVVCIIYDIEKLTRLREEGSDLAVAPPRNDTLSIMHEENTIALKTGHLNSQKLLPIFSVPDSDFVD